MNALQFNVPLKRVQARRKSFFFASYFSIEKINKECYFCKSHAKFATMIVVSQKIEEKKIEEKFLKRRFPLYPRAIVFLSPCHV
jgi:hypothetical protein